MPQVPDRQTQLLDALPHIDAVLRHVARRYRLSVDEAEELGSRVRLRLIEDDYRVFRAFEGRSEFRTYLTTVVTRLFLDERTRAWGKWRPSSEARRLGPTAIILERLLTRDHLPVDEAVQTLCARDGTLTEGAVLAVLERLPARRATRRHVDATDLAALPDPGPGSDHLVTRNAQRSGWRSASAALAEVVAGLPPRQRLLIELRYHQGCRVSDIAKVVQEDAKPLYRYYDQLIASLRRQMEERGISKEQIAELLQTAPDDEELPARIDDGASVPSADDIQRSPAAG